jgi:hypothetical protein
MRRFARLAPGLAVGRALGRVLGLALARVLGPALALVVAAGLALMLGAGSGAARIHGEMYCWAEDSELPVACGEEEEDDETGG